MRILLKAGLANQRIASSLLRARFDKPKWPKHWKIIHTSWPEEIPWQHQFEYSLKNLLGSCINFDEEETMLQSMGCKMGVMIDRMLKYHPELAGEGIEYSWGCAKNFYKRKMKSLWVAWENL
jgi:hypothetical protein